MIGCVGNGDGVTVTGINVAVGRGVGETVIETDISVDKAAGWLPQDTRNTNKMLKE